MACGTAEGIQAACLNLLTVICRCADLPHLLVRMALKMLGLLQENRVATLQSLSGTGSLRVAAEFIAKFLPGKTAYLSNPTWGNHKVRPAYCLELLVPTPWLPSSLSLRHICIMQTAQRSDT